MQDGWSASGRIHSLNELDQTTNLFILASVTPDSVSSRIVCTRSTALSIYHRAGARLTYGLAHKRKKIAYDPITNHTQSSL